ncbi:transposase [Streptomyces sp. P9-A4]|uniref:transposase n=1 Tax=Streptomyces sp. P9-A4 TaxID=3072285 RepID=UPI002FC9EC02
MTFCAGCGRAAPDTNPGWVAADLAVMLADGGDAVADLALLRDQPDMRPVAFTHRLAAAGRHRCGHALRRAPGPTTAREVAWLQAGETHQGIPAARSGGRDLPGLVLDIDATLITCHPEKQQAAPTYRGGFGYGPPLRLLGRTGEALAEVLRPGNAGVNIATDHIAVLDAAMAQIPDAHRHGTENLVRADSAGSAKTFLAHLRAMRSRDAHTSFSVGCHITGSVRRAIRQLPDQVRHPALEQDGTVRNGAEAAELTSLVDVAGCRGRRPPSTAARTSCRGASLG